MMPKPSLITEVSLATYSRKKLYTYFYARIKKLIDIFINEQKEGKVRRTSAF